MRFALLAVAVLTSACASNPYTQFYQGTPNARLRPDYQASASPLQIFSSSDFNRDVLELMRRGYGLVGQSSFNIGMNLVSESQLRKQSEAVGAHIVLVAARYTNTVSGAVPLTIPKTATTTSNGIATVSGAGGTATIVGSSSSITQSTQTVILPYSVARGDIAALFFVRVKPRLGVSVVPLDDSTRLRLQSNFGVVVQVVIEGSPAFEAEILPGDILLQIGSDRVRSVEHFSELLDRYQGRVVELVVDRRGREVRKTLRILTLSSS
jgi:hypothetical protein